MKILVTGGAGYLGTVLLPKLLARGHRVRTIDTGYFGLGHLKGITPAPEIIRDDIRKILSGPEYGEKLLEGIDCVIHLAAMSNDPAAELDPKYTEQLNTQVTAELAKQAKGAGLRFLFASSCSVYGGQGTLLDENSELGPLTVYAVSKAKAEKEILKLESDAWKPTILRFGTLFGYSARMRFDLVVNVFSLFSVLKHSIKVFGSGKHWRPYLHVKDCANVLTYFAEKANAQHRIYNVSHVNLRVSDLASIFKTLIPQLNVVEVPDDGGDARNYRVSNERLKKEGVTTRYDIETGA